MAWEYIVVARRMDQWVVNGRDDGETAGVLIELLNKLGAQGWELVTALGDPSSPRMYMKRAVS